MIAPFKTLASVCGAALMAGCSLAPLYERPAAPIPTLYPASAPPVEAAKPPTVENAPWRRQFPDSRLRRLITAALERNRDLKLAAARVEEARALRGLQSADRLPTITAEGTTTHPSQDNQSAHQVGVALSAYELDLFGKTKSLSDAALHELLATEHAQRAATISVVAEVARGYIVERTAAARVALAQKAIASRQAAVALLIRRAEAGVSSPLEVQQARTLVGAAETDLIEQQLTQARAGHALALLTGHAPTDEESRAAPPPGVSPLGTGWPAPRAGLPSDLLTARPDIIAAEQRLMAANAQIGAARAAFFPSIRLTALGGVASNDLNALFSVGSGAWQFAPQVSLPLFDGGRNRSNLELAQAREVIAVVEYERTIQTAFREVSDALAGQTLLERDVATRAALRDVEANRQTLTMKRYLAGAVGYLEVLDAERGRFAAEQALLDAQRARLENLVALYRALGGNPSSSD